MEILHNGSSLRSESLRDAPEETGQGLKRIAAVEHERNVLAEAARPSRQPAESRIG
jgi:hypothetical protein